MPKNVSTSEDILETLMFPLNEAQIISGFAYNYLRTLGLRPEKKEELSISSKQGTVKLTIERKRGSREIEGYVKFDFKKRPIRFYFGSKKELMDTILMIKSEFMNAESGWLDVKGRDVLDIGAYVGDTALFFALDGAKHVYALEPYPYFHKIGQKNIVANRMQRKITLLNSGVAGKMGSVMIDSSHRGFSGKKFNGKKDQKKVSILSLEHLVKKYNLKDAALKVDCEGYEYDILLGASEQTLRKFEDVEVEYHYGYLNIEKRFRDAGFSVSHHKPMKRFNFGTRTVMVNGFMHAKRIGK